MASICLGLNVLTQDGADIMASSGNLSDLNAQTIKLITDNGRPVWYHVQQITHNDL